jgi:hypothetical protein
MKAKHKRALIALASRRLKRGGPRVTLEELERRLATGTTRKRRPKT